MALGLGTLFTTDSTANTVRFINSGTGQPIVTLPSGGINPVAIDITPDGGRLCVLNFANDIVNIIDIRNARSVALIRVGRNPIDIAFDPEGLYAYVPLNGSNSIAVIDLRRNIVVNSIPVTNEPTGIVIVPVFGLATLAYVTGRKQLLIFNVIGGSFEPIPTPVPFFSFGTHKPAVNRIGTKVLMSSITSAQVAILQVGAFDGNMVRFVTVGNIPAGIAITDDDNFAYVACFGDNAVHAINLGSATSFRRIPFKSPREVSFSPTGNQFVYVSHDQSNGAGAISRYDRQSTQIIVLNNSFQGVARTLKATPLIYTISTTVSSATIVSKTIISNTDPSGQIQTKVPKILLHKKVRIKIRKSYYQQQSTNKVKLKSMKLPKSAIFRKIYGESK